MVRRTVCVHLPLIIGLLFAGCGRSAPNVEPVPVQVQTFATIDKLSNQIEAITDAKARDELMATVERLRGQVAFGDLRMPPAARLLLARQINVLPMTQVADWNNDGTLDGFEVQVEALDHFGDPTKLVGKLFFELYAFRAAHADRRSLKRAAYWEVNIETVDDLRRFWDRFNRTYHFNLVWPQAPEIGRKYIFQITYVAPWGEVFEAQRTLTRTD